MLYLVGDLLEWHVPKQSINPSWVRVIQEHYRDVTAKDPQDPYARMVLGNFLGIAGHWFTSWEDEAIDLTFDFFLKKADRRPPALFEIVALQFFGFRSLSLRDRFSARFTKLLQNEYPPRPEDRATGWFFWAESSNPEIGWKRVHSADR